MTRLILRGFGLVFLFLIAATASAAAPSRNANQAKEELSELKGRIEGVQRRLAEAEESKTDTLDQLRASERAISDANRALSELTGQSRDANARLAQIKVNETAARDQLGKHQEALGRLLYQQYAAGRPETVAILLNGREPNAIARELHYFTYVARARADMLERLRATIAELQALAKEAEEKAIELAQVTAEQLTQRTRLEQEKRARAQVLTRVSREIDVRRREMVTLKRDETRLSQLVEQLAKVIARTPAPRARRAPEPRLRNERVPQRSDDTSAFAQLRGKLALPVRGELGNRFGSPRQDGGVIWKGLLIAAPAGEEVKAVAAGRVVFADWLRGFGNLLIVDHGDNYMSLYGYNETLFKRVGDVIRAGERVAAVGSSGGNGESGLYFELRHEGRPFDPLSWVSR